MEHCNVVALSGRQSYAQIAEMIQAVGSQRYVLGTDLGQFNNPYPVEGYRSFVAALLLNGLSEEDLLTVALRNAVRVLRLDSVETRVGAE
jgi:microsomal dipeptidase-like Zn-dependent dipeptidase